MAILTSAQLASVRQQLELDATLGGVNFSKTQANLAIQAIEDWFEANRGSLSTAVNAATSPFVFAAAQKKLLVLYWLLSKYGRGG